MFSSNTSQVEGGYQISRSLRFNSADSAYLNRTPASAGNRKTFTVSCWVKRSGLGSTQVIWEGGSPDTVTTRLFLRFQSDDTLRLATSGAAIFNTTQVFRDVSAWYHIIVAMDTTQATAANRARLYVNGSEVTAFSSTSYPGQNDDTGWNMAQAHSIGRTHIDAAGYFSGYMTEIYNIDGQQLTPSSFGETNAQTGVWQPKAYSGSYGTNGFYLNFSDNSNTTAATLGKDYSGNGNNWTPNNFSVAAGAGNDSLVDTPTPYGVDTGAGGEVRGNYATFNPIYAIPNNASNTFSNGNLNWTTNVSEGSGEAAAVTTFPLPSSGKWYWEVTPTTVATVAANRTQIGIMSQANINNNGAGGTSATDSFAYTAAGGSLSKVSGNSYASYGNSYTTNDVIGVAVDLDNGAIYFSKNGTWQNSGVPTSGSSKTGAAYTTLTGSSNYFPNVAYYGNFALNMGQRPFAYTAPSGFKALCTQNLPTPTIGATTATQASQYFAPVIYTGTGAAQTITVGFQPDFVWLKSRVSAVWYHQLYDVIRTPLKALFSNATDAETTYTDTLTAFASNGFSLGTDATYNGPVNKNGDTYVSWNWKANGAGVTNTAGSITSTVSANTTSGFSVVTYTGTGANATVGHGLGVAPSMIIQKNRTGFSWRVYHISTGNGNELYLDTTAAATSASTWNNTTPTSTVFSIGSGSAINGGGNACVAYCFAAVPGFSAFGSYTGNGADDGPFVFTGFKPAWILIKRSSTAGENWTLYDNKRNSYNVANRLLFPNSSDAEDVASATILDMVSNGFKLRGQGLNVNASGSTYIYAAFAENPFKYSLAR